MTTPSNEDEQSNLPCDSPQDAIEEHALQSRLNFERNIQAQNMWNHSALGMEAKRAAMTMLSTKHGMYARIPLICKADSCPYAENCPLLAYNLAPQGEACPIETAQIELRYQGYASDFNFDDSSFTDRNLVSELINLDVMIERCKALISREGVPVVDVVAGIAENGEEFYRPEVSKYFEAYERTMKRRNEVYQLMMATRRDRKGDIVEEKSIQDILAEVIDVEQNGGFTIDERPAHLKGE